MDKDAIKGKAKQAAGKLRRKAGELTGDKDLEIRGAAQDVEGKLQENYGKAKDKARNIADELKR
jgi:uncharacterized protein YjbJ (UPF0337 family)